MRKAKSIPDPLAFRAVCSLEEFQELKTLAQEFSVSRNVVFMSLTQSGHEMAQAAWVHGDAFMEVMQCAMDYQTHLEARLGLVKSAVARLIIVGQELSDHGKPSYVTGDQEPAMSA